MSREAEKEKERLLDLLADRAMQGLGAEENSELNELLKKYPDYNEMYFEIASAAVDLANLEIDEPLPSALRAKVLSDAYRFVDSSQRDFAGGANAEQNVSEPARVISLLPKTRWWYRAGWYAAAACLALAAVAWYVGLRRQEPQRLTVAELRQRLLAEAPDLVQSSWSPTNYENAKSVQGDVVWSNARQQGFMRFQGLPAINPSENEYQLWIFDAERDERYPVDGGVFDIDPQTGEAVVQIRAKLKVSQPKLFAVTIEKPGGVVVSKREKLVLLAKVE